MDSVGRLVWTNPRGPGFRRRLSVLSPDYFQIALHQAVLVQALTGGMKSLLSYFGESIFHFMREAIFLEGAALTVAKAAPRVCRDV